MKKTIFLWVVFFELVVVAFLVGKIYLKQSQVLGENVSINPISKNDVIFPNSDSETELKYFYEKKSNIIVDKKPDWLPNNYKSTINGDGLNERFDYSIDKNSDIFRIVTIGDSFTFGAYVNTEENYPERLEDLLNNELSCKNLKKFEIINLGEEGYDIEYSVERFKIRGSKYNPDLVLWFLKEDDFAHINEVIRPKKTIYKKEIQESGKLKQYEEQGIFNPDTVKALEELSQEWTPEEILNYQKSALNSFSNYYKGRLVIFTFPVIETEYRIVLEEFVKSRGNALFYDGIPNTYSLGETLPDRHPSARAYSLIAKNLFSYLVGSNIIPCD